MYKRLSIKTLVIVFMIALTANHSSYADENQSSPLGLPGHKPLHFVAVSLEDGGDVQNATNIPTQPKFKIVFDKNVVANTVWANNLQCISLLNADNENIPITISKIDDTMDFTQKTNIFVQPVNALTPGTAYKLYISPDLKAKNGSLGEGTGGQGITIPFTTAGPAPVQATQETNQAPPKSLATPVGTKAAPGNGDVSAVSGELPNGEASFHNWQALLVAALIAGWLLIEYLLKKRKPNR